MLEYSAGAQIHLTSKDMAKSPRIIMQVFGHQFLGRWLHWEILHAKCHKIFFKLIFLLKKKKNTGECYRILNRKKQGMKILYTRGGKIFSAARRGTENPPWVLVSLGVSVLQKNSICGLIDLSASSDAINISLSNCITVSNRLKILAVELQEK